MLTGLLNRGVVKVKFSILLIFLAFTTFSQQTLVKGRVTEASNGNPIPFANIIFKGTSIGITTDFSGYYQLESNTAIDSIVASYIGFITRVKAIKQGESQEINFQLIEDIKQLTEVVFVAEQNPAWAIMRQVVKNKKKHDKRSLEGYELDSYNKIEISLDNLNENFRNRRIVQKVKKVIDSVDQIAGEDGKAVLPIFVSESISKNYYRKNPELRKEQILKTKLTGVGITDGTLTSQFTGSTFQEYNFYQNWLNIWDKDFVSPIADGWRIYYEIYLTDSLFIGDDYCYKIEIYPRRDEDLAFEGSIWITKNEFALKQIDVYVDKKTNLNFVEKIRIQQELAPTEAGPWIPVNSRILTDFQILAEFGFGKQSAGVLAKFFSSNKNWIINEPKPIKFFNQSIEIEEDAQTNDDQFWRQNRHVPLTSTEESVFNMIDTLRNIPVVRRLSDVITWALSGYIEIGKFDFGPWPWVYANNNIEGHRFRFGGSTDIEISNKWTIKGYIAYGTKDNEIKYGVGYDYILSRKPWTELRFYHGKDIQQVGLTFDDVFSNINQIAFETFYRNRNHFQPYFLTEYRAEIRHQFYKGVNTRISFKQRKYEPINVDSSFNYAYLEDPNLGSTSALGKDFDVSEFNFEVRYGQDELWVTNDNQRMSLGPIKQPVFTLKYTVGIDNLLSSDFGYHKLIGNILKKIKMGPTGISNVSVTGGKIFGQVPLPLLRGHIGNETPFYVSLSYNTMGFSEFVSDRWVELNYLHQFEGFLLNRIPLFRKLKWRTVANFNILKGHVSEKNLEIHSDTGTNGLPNDPINALGNDPYMEIGYGLENILKVLKIQAFHRLTYLENREGDKFSLKFSFQIIF